MILRTGIFKKSYIFLTPQLDETLQYVNRIVFPLTLSEADTSVLFFNDNFFLKLEDTENLLFHKNKFIAWYRIKTFYFVLIVVGNQPVKVRIDIKARKKLWEQYIEINSIAK